MRLPAIFNPSNDMALAVNLRQYTPPFHIQQMEVDLANLANLWDEGPWGWSLATKQRYLRMGIPETELPTDDWLAEHRRLSSREFSCAYYSRLTQSLSTQDLVPCRARFVTELADLTHMHEVILKAPWSSSGKGNLVIHDEADMFQHQRITHIVHQQGGILVEPYYSGKQMDLAMEFWVDDETTEFLGYSIFFSDEMGHYGGNLVESQEQLRKRIGLSDNLLQGLITYHKKELSRLNYNGPVGIDMMLLRDGRLHPLVEINFRMTMGMLALLLQRKGYCNDIILAGNAEHGFTAQIRAGKFFITFCPYL